MHTSLTDTTGRARELARILDSAFRVPGTRFRFGLDPVLGLVPGLGDAIAAGFGSYLLMLAFRAGAPRVIMVRMFANIGADLLLGSIPLLGDLFDAGYKANLRNLSLLESYLARPEQSTKRSLALLLVFLVVLLAILIATIWLIVAVVGAVLSALS